MSFLIIFCFFIWFFSLVVKSKQQQQQKQKNTPVPPVAAPPPRSVFEKKVKSGKSSTLSKKSENIPKNEHVAVFESISSESFDEWPSQDNYQCSFVEKNQQSTDNEEIKNVDLQFDTDEIKKGVIYSIILKRPEY